MGTIEVSAEAFAKLPADMLEQVYELAKAERLQRIEHHADDECAKHEEDEAFHGEAGSRMTPDELEVGDVYEDGGRWYQVDDITAVGSGDDLTYHVVRTMVDD